MKWILCSRGQNITTTNVDPVFKMNYLYTMYTPFAFEKQL